MQERDIVRYHYYSIEAPITAIISPRNTYCIIWTNESIFLEISLIIHGCYLINNGQFFKNSKFQNQPRPNGLLPFCYLTIKSNNSEKIRSSGNEVGSKHKNIKPGKGPGKCFR